MKHIPPKTPSRPSNNTGRDATPKSVILYVEDDAVNQQIACARLGKKYDILLASNDREACKTLSDHHATIIVVLMDIELQGSKLNGIDLTRLFRGKLPANERPLYTESVPTIDVPILFVTAYGQRFNQNELLEAGADNVIAKPIDFVQLQTAMTRTYLNRQRR
jgi:CheY-like chemotaxis protein